MKKRVINFGDNRLFGGVGEWGLVLTAWAGGMGKGVSSCLESLNSSYPSLPENPSMQYQLANRSCSCKSFLHIEYRFRFPNLNGSNLSKIKFQIK